MLNIILAAGGRLNLSLVKYYSCCRWQVQFITICLYETIIHPEHNYLFILYIVQYATTAMDMHVLVALCLLLASLINIYAAMKLVLFLYLNSFQLLHT